MATTGATIVATTEGITTDTLGVAKLDIVRGQGILVYTVARIELVFIHLKEEVHREKKAPFVKTRDPIRTIICTLTVKEMSTSAKKMVAGSSKGKNSRAGKVKETI